MSIYLTVIGTVVSLFAAVLLLSSKFSYYRTAYATGRKADKTCVLSKSPNHIGTWDVVELAVAVVWKQLFQSDTSRYLRGCYIASQKCFRLPPLTFQGLLEIEVRDALVFRRAVYGDGASSAVVEKSDDVNPLFLVAMTGPVVVLLLADAATPIRPIGALNTRNVFKVVDPAFCRDFTRILEASQNQELSYKAVFGGDFAPAYRRRSGLEFSITITVFHKFAVVLQQQLYFLQRLPKSFQPRFEGVSGEEQASRRPAPGAPPSTSVMITQRDPRLWAAACKDYNPIHISPLLARAFGFKSVIAHGNHVAARVVEQLRTTVGAPPTDFVQKCVWQNEKPYSIETRFLRPMVLPTQLEVWWEASGAQGGPAGERVDFLVGKEGIISMTGFVQEST